MKIAAGAVDDDHCGETVELERVERFREPRDAPHGASAFVTFAVYVVIS
jgi:hypothetical protein